MLDVKLSWQLKQKENINFEFHKIPMIRRPHSCGKIVHRIIEIILFLIRDVQKNTHLNYKAKS